MLPFSVNLLNLLLKIGRNPDGLIETGHRINRRLCGFLLKEQPVDRWVWPYLEGGEGETIVLLHGFGADKDRFGSFLPLIRRSCRMVVPDIPGFGKQHQLWSARYDIDSQVRRLEGFIDAIGLDRFHLMGVSLGGYLAGYYTARNPGRAKSLCLMDSAGFSSPADSDALELFKESRQNIFLPGSDMEMQTLMDHLLHRPLKLPATLKAYWLQQTLDLRSWRQKLFDDLLDGGIYLMDDLAGRIKVPTLVIWGAEDRICHVATVDNILALIEDCRAYIIYDCGHIPILEFPSLSARLYRDFIDGIG